MALYDQCALLLHLLREALHFCSPQGTLRTQHMCARNSCSCLT